MNTIIKTTARTAGLTAGVAGCLALAPAATAEVSEADFRALQETVRQLSAEVQSLKATNTVAEQLHDQDLQQLHQLQAQMADTARTAADAEEKSAAAAQPLPRVPIDEATVNHNFQILGDAEVQFAKATGQNGSFYLADFAPIFLYRGGDNILFEAGFDTTIANNNDPTTTPPNQGAGYTTTFNLSFAQLDYVMSDYLTLSAGDMLLPLGTYAERGAGWLNKIPDDPLARQLLPDAGVGAQLRGAVPLGDAGKILNYSVYGVNGPSSSDTTGDATSLDLGGNVGPNLHTDPAGGGRVGVFLPFKPRYDLELGLSGLAGQWDSSGNHLYTAGVLDAALHLGPNFEAKGEYIRTRYGSDDQGMISQNGWWAQVGYKLSGLNLELPGINNLELVGRYDALHDGLGTTTRRYTAGYVYYITTALLFEGDYEFITSNDASQNNQLIFQLSYGF
jgi:hypothetical protein